MVNYKLRTQFGTRFVKGQGTTWYVTDKKGYLLFESTKYDDAINWAYLEPSA